MGKIEILAFRNGRVTAYMDTSATGRIYRSGTDQDFGTEEEFMARMTTADLKGDTARGARAISEAQSKRSTKPKPDPDERKPATALPSADLAPEWDQYPELVGLDFDQLIAKRVDLKSEIDFRTKRLKELDEEIQSQLAVAGTEKVTWEGRPVQVVHSRSGSKIVAEKLLLAGVPASTISDATEEGKPYQYLLVGKAGTGKQ